MEQPIGLAVPACACLDMHALKAGAFGPECKVTQVLRKPAGAFAPRTDAEVKQHPFYDFRYTPRRAGTDTVRFILENGAGKKIDVTVKLITRMYHSGLIEGGEEYSARSAELDSMLIGEMRADAFAVAEYKSRNNTPAQDPPGVRIVVAPIGNTNRGHI